MNRPDSIGTKGFSRTFNMYLMLDFPFRTNPHFSVALGPGFATDVPATFMYTMSFSRGQIGLGAASATMMLATVAALVIPYLYSELRSKPHDR